MANYGPGQRRTTKSSSGRSTPARATSSRAASSRTSSSRTGSSRSADRTEPVARGRASAELRSAIEGREHEFAGIGFIVVGLLLALAIWFHVAGPLGRGIEVLVGWFTGLGRFVVPVALFGVGADIA